MPYIQNDMKKLSVLFLVLLGAVTAQAQTESTKAPLTVGVKITPPFIMKTEAGYTGLSIDLRENISKQLDIAYNNFLELLDAVEKGRVDISVNPFSVTSEREEKMDFTQPFYVANLALAVAAEQNTPYAFVKNLFSIEFFKVIGLLFIVILIFGGSLKKSGTMNSEPAGKAWGTVSGGPL